jgi:hypothetical protein
MEEPNIRIEVVDKVGAEPLCTCERVISEFVVPCDGGFAWPTRPTSVRAKPYRFEHLSAALLAARRTGAVVIKEIRSRGIDA